MGGFMMGAYFVASGISQYLGGVVATYASVPRNITDPLESLPIYTSLFNKLGIAALVCTLIAIAVLPLMKRLSLAHSHQETAGSA
jgi:POT family proton-dependent oligopeptide transporter